MSMVPMIGHRIGNHVPTGHFIQTSPDGQSPAAESSDAVRFVGTVTDDVDAELPLQDAPRPHKPRPSGTWKPSVNSLKW
jgi:hypothetical protein